MSENIYDILAKFPKDAPAIPQEPEPIYESIDPRDELLEDVRKLEEKFYKYKTTPQVSTKNTDDASDFKIAKAKRELQLAMAEYPEAGSPTEALVARMGDQAEETKRMIDNARTTIAKQQQDITRAAQAVNDANARYDAQEKRFQDFTKQVAATELDVRQQAQAALAFAQQPQADPQDIIAQIQAQTPAPVAPVEPTSEPEEPEQTPTVKPVQKQPAEIPTPTAKVVDITKARDNKAAEKAAQNKLAQQVAEPAAVTNMPDPFDQIAAEAVDNIPATTPIPVRNWKIIQHAVNNPVAKTNLIFADGKQLPLSRLDVLAVYNYFYIKSKRRGEYDLEMMRNLINSTLNDYKTADRLLGLKIIDRLRVVMKKKDKQKNLATISQTPTQEPNQQQTQQNPASKPGLASTQFGKYVQEPKQADLFTQQKPVQRDLFGNNNMNENIKNIAENLMERFANFKEEAKPDFLDLDKDGDTEEPMKSAAKSAKDEEPAKPDADAVAKRKRLQALKDKQEDERAEKDDYDKSSSRVVKGRAYGGAAQKDDEEKDLDESGLQAYLGKKKYGKEGMKALQKAGREGASKEKMAMLRAKHDKMDEVAPPGAKAERMVKHIKKGYSKDGKLTPKEKGIAYATAWKAKKAGKLEESRNAESSEYTYETIGRILSEEQPNLDCNSEAFIKAVYDELIELKLTPKAARWLCHYDEDFLSDTASAYSHFCQSKEKEMAECGAPMNAFVSEEPMLDAVQELDEIARLAGLPKMEAKCSSCGCADCKCNESSHMIDEAAINEAATRKDFRMVADLLKAIPDIAKRTELAMYHADIFKQQNSRFKKEMFLAAAGVDTSPIKDESVETEGNAFTGKLADTPKGGEFELDGKKFKDTSTLEEEEMEEGNEFSGALAKAKAAGEKEFEVDGKKYTVKEDINLNVSATGEEDVVNLIRKLSGMPVVAIQAQPAVAEEVVAEEGPKERDVEYTNSPREVVAGTDAAIPAGADLNRAKKQYKKEYPGDNPMAVAEAKEEQLWKSYEAMINDVKA